MPDEESVNLDSPVPVDRGIEIHGLLVRPILIIRR